LREITEEEAFSLAGDAECPVLRKEESDPQEAAVCLKRFPTGYLLGASDKVRDLHLWLFDDLDAAERRYDELVSLLREHGTPFGSLSRATDAEPSAAADGGT
jgi:hypothetical protein